MGRGDGDGDGEGEGEGRRGKVGNEGAEKGGCKTLHRFCPEGIKSWLL